LMKRQFTSSKLLNHFLPHSPVNVSECGLLLAGYCIPALRIEGKGRERQKEKEKKGSTSHIIIRITIRIIRRRRRRLALLGL
jgi:hypothetical protein